jgi:hypothetical protein
LLTFAPLQVQLAVSGNTYEVRFIPGTESTPIVARDFCTQQASTLGIELADCVGPVADYLQKAVEADAATKMNEARVRQAQAAAEAALEKVCDLMIYCLHTAPAQQH